MAGWGLGYGGVRNPDPEGRFDGTPFSNFDLPDGISVLTLKIIDTYGMRMNKLLTTIWKNPRLFWSIIIIGGICDAIFFSWYFS
jgi:hypothetical protein